MAEFKNPNQQGGSGPGSQGGGSSLLMYFALTLVVFLGLQYFWGKHPKPAANPPTVTQSHAAPAVPAEPPAGEAPAAQTHTAQNADADAIQAQAVTPIVVDTPLYRITFSNRGGQVTSWILKKYKNLTTDQPLDLVNKEAAAKFGYPLSLQTYQPQLTRELAQALYVPSSTAATLTAPTTLSFKYSANGLQVTKTFSFNDTYVMSAKVTVTQNGAPVTAGLAWPAGFGDQHSLPEYANSDFNRSQDGKTDQVEYKKVSGGKTLTGNYNWAGVSDLYFAAIFLPDHPQNASFVTLNNAVDVPLNVKKPGGETKSAPVLGVIENADNGTLDCRLFVGPKTLQALSAVKGANGGPSLEGIVSFGYTTVIAKPLFLILRWIHKHMVGNWGWSILVLTLLLSLLTLPTRISMMRSSLKMQRIQPQMDAIKQRYAKYKATDPKRQEMNQEIFKVQKENGVNMFGSCLPMLIQWPLLFAFYRMLENVIELRQAHWLWIPDLSAPDPYHILPIFFIVSMFLVQFLTPSPGVDKQQQRLMAFTMPAVFGFMTWSIASGLALYWAASNVLGIFTQLAINQSKMGREMREMALRRAAKKQGKVINAKVVPARR